MVHHGDIIQHIHRTIFFEISLVSEVDELVIVNAFLSLNLVTLDWFKPVTCEITHDSSIVHIIVRLFLLEI